MEHPEMSFTRYLSAKKSVDDRALNQGVWQTLWAAVPSSRATPLRVLELGAGIGTMIERILEQGRLAQADYTALDAQMENLQEASLRLPRFAQEHALQYEAISDGLCLRSQDQCTTIHLRPDDALAFAVQPEHHAGWDLLIAHAFLDLLNLPRALPALLRLLRPGGLFYFSLNFDGMTLLEPSVDPDFEEQVEAAYHRTMDERIIANAPSGDSRSGRHLFTHLKAAGADILEAGASDWVVFPQSGKYAGDEAYFLQFILHTMEGALHNAPHLDSARFANWIEARRKQLARGELIYLAHQLDFVGRWPGDFSERV